MKTDIPRSEAPILSPEPSPSPTGWTWFALVGLHDPPLTLGRSPEQAEAALVVRLRDFYARDADPLPDDPEERVQDTLRRYRRGALICGSAGDEVASFLAWKHVSSLEGSEALLRWRAVFPCPTPVDPLRRVSARLPTPAERVRRMDADPRYRVLGATASRLPRASERRMTRYKDLASQPTSG